MTGRQAVGATFFFLFVAVLANSANSADAKRQFAVRGVGTHACDEYLKTSHDDEVENARYADWLTGFITAYNWLQPDTYDIAPLSQYKQASMLNFLDHYCAANPKKRVIDAALAFVRAIYDRRDKAAP
jgi:hypothetical protein